jgi:hypothetical protein
MTGRLRPVDAAAEIKLQDIAEQFAKERARIVGREPSLRPVWTPTERRG